MLSMADSSRVLKILISAFNGLHGSQLSGFEALVLFAAFATIFAHYVSDIVVEAITHFLLLQGHPRLVWRGGIRSRLRLRTHFKFGLYARFMSRRAVAGQFLAVFEDFIDNFALKVVHVLVFELLDCIAAHDFIANLVLVLTDHQTRILRVRVALVSNLVIAKKLLFHLGLEYLILVIAELVQWTDSPGVV